MKMKSIRECELTRPNVKHVTIDYEVTETGRDNTGRKISCVVKISNTYNVNIYNVYVPNLGNDKKIFINQSISMNPADKNIVLGDFNCTLLKSLDRKPIPNRMT
jgi:hypothetical protein